MVPSTPESIMFNNWFSSLMVSRYNPNPRSDCSDVFFLPTKFLWSYSKNSNYFFAENNLQIMWIVGNIQSQQQAFQPALGLVYPPHSLTAMPRLYSPKSFPGSTSSFSGDDHVYLTWALQNIWQCGLGFLFLSLRYFSASTPLLALCSFVSMEKIILSTNLCSPDSIYLSYKEPWSIFLIPSDF